MLYTLGALGGVFEDAVCGVRYTGGHCEHIDGHKQVRIKVREHVAVHVTEDLRAAGGTTVVGCKTPPTSLRLPTIAICTNCDRMLWRLP